VQILGGIRIIAQHLVEKLYIHRLFQLLAQTNLIKKNYPDIRQ
jgi:hypothetical protein